VRLVGKRKCPGCGEFRRLRKPFSFAIFGDSITAVPYECRVCGTFFYVRREPSNPFERTILALEKRRWREEVRR